MLSTDSVLIEKLRFPLAVMVVFIHTGNRAFTDGGEWLRITLAKVIPAVAVPLFFLIAGYLFFQGLNYWHWKTWRDKLSRRVYSLLIPYLLWIGLYVLYAYLHQSRLEGEWLPLGNWFSGNGGLKMWWDCIVTEETGPLGLATVSAHPYHRVLWFVRDLMVVNILSPLLHFCLRKCRGWFVLFLFVLYVFKIWPPLHSLGISCVFFYSWGAWLAQNKKSLAAWFGRWKKPAFVLSVAMFIPIVLLWENAHFVVLKPVWTIIWGMAFICLVGISKTEGRWASCTFFIYVTHSVVLSNIRQAFILLPSSPMPQAIVFLLTGTMTVLICVLVYYCIMKKFFPQITLCLCGKNN